ncbi:MAG: 2-phosphosulfolactate phosphatase, partial [Candidatus Ranarchaeia archaeon]
KKYQNSLLCGERGGHPPAGFDLGNSPRQYKRDLVENKTIILTTSNCTRIIHTLEKVRSSHNASSMPVICACFRNIDATANWLTKFSSQNPDVNITLLAAGKEKLPSPDDHVAARYLYSLIVNKKPADSLSSKAILKALRESPHGRKLIAEGLGDDIPFCAELNATPIVPKLEKGVFVAAKRGFV